MIERYIHGKVYSYDRYVPDWPEIHQRITRELTDADSVTMEGMPDTFERVRMTFFRRSSSPPKC